MSPGRSWPQQPERSSARARKPRPRAWRSPVLIEVQMLEMTLKSKSARETRVEPSSDQQVLLRTLETAKRDLVMSITPDICWTFSMRFLTAWVWSARAAFRMSLILLDWLSAHWLYMGPPNLMSAPQTLRRQKATTVSSLTT